MNYVTVKHASDIKLAGITVNLEHVNNSLKVVTLTDGKGGLCRFSAGNYESANVTVPAPPKKETRYVLRGELPVVGAIVKQFTEKCEADAAKSEIEATYRNDLNLKITKEEIEVTEPNAKASADDMPF